MYNDFIHEISASHLDIHGDHLDAYMPVIRRIAAGETVADMRPETMMNIFDPLARELKNTETEEQPQNGVAVVPIRGMLSKYGSPWNAGTEEYGKLLKQLYEQDNVKSIVLQFHSPGGTNHSVFPLEEAIRRRNKPVLAVVDSQALSAGYYLASLCDKIYAVNRMAEVGSIGVMAQIRNWEKFYEKEGLKTIRLIPPESRFKNKGYMDALDGNPETLINEELRPWAVHFQNVVRANRPRLDMAVEGLIEGKMFYAFDAENNGLVDEVKPLDQVVKEAFEYSKNQVQKLFT